MEIRLFPYGLISLEPLFLTPTYYSLPHPFALLPTLVLVSYDLPELVPSSEHDTYFRQPFLFPKGEEAAFVVVAPVPT
jgi:hypothetical protein